MTWAVGEIVTSGPEGGQVIAGWVWKSFGIDFRPIWEPEAEAPWGAGWCVTHLPTGFAVAGLVMSREEAIAFCEEIDGWAKWELVDFRTSGFLWPRMKEMIARLGPRFVQPRDLATPWGSYSVEISAPEAVA